MPLYGKTNHKELAEVVLEYEVELCKANKMSEMILAATLIMSNKILDDETFKYYLEGRNDTLFVIFLSNSLPIINKLLYKKTIITKFLQTC